MMMMMMIYFVLSFAIFDALRLCPPRLIVTRTWADVWGCGCISGYRSADPAARPSYFRRGARCAGGRYHREGRQEGEGEEAETPRMPALSSTLSLLVDGHIFVCVFLVST